MHFRWVPVKERIIELLNETTLDKLSAAVKSGKYRLADVPLRLFSELDAVA